TTETSPALRSKSHRASITSSPLFISVAESIVILLPITQVGCLSACSTVIDSKPAAGSPRNGPPDAVKIIRFNDSRPRPSRHWKTALCSLSTGSSRTRLSRTAAVISSPAMTSTSLLANAMSLPALIAASVGRKPIAPTSADITSSASGCVATAIAPSSPCTTFTRCAPTRVASSRASSGVATDTSSGWKRFTCSVSRSRLRPAAIAATRKRSLKRPTTSSVVTPTDPVEPRIEIAFIATRSVRRGLRQPLSETPERHQRKAMRVQVVSKIKMIRKAAARRLSLVPGALIVLPFREPLHAAHRCFADSRLARDQSDQRPRRLRRGAGSAPVPRGIFVRQRALAPAAVGILLRLEPLDRPLDPGLVNIDADRPQARQRRVRAIDIVDAPASPPSARRRLISLEPFDRAFRHRMLGAIADRRHHIEHSAGEIGTRRIRHRFHVRERQMIEPG